MQCDGTVCNDDLLIRCDGTKLHLAVACVVGMFLYLGFMRVYCTSVGWNAVRSLWSAALPCLCIHVVHVQWTAKCDTGCFRQATAQWSLLALQNAPVGSFCNARKRHWAWIKWPEIHENDPSVISAFFRSTLYTLRQCSAWLAAAF